MALSSEIHPSVMSTFAENKLLNQLITEDSK